MRSTDYASNDPPAKQPPREALIPGWTGYMVNELGHLHSCRGQRSRRGDSRVWKPITICLSKRYYKAVLHRDGPLRLLARVRPEKTATGLVRVGMLVESHTIPKHVYVRDLVALAFLGPKPADFRLWSMDGDTTNHRLSNLQYRHKDDPPPLCRSLYRPSVKGERSRAARLSDVQVVAIRRKFHELILGGSIPKHALLSLRAEYGVGSMIDIVTGRQFKDVDAGVPLFVQGVIPPTVMPRILTQADEDAIRHAARSGRPCRRLWAEEYAARCSYGPVHAVWKDERKKVAGDVDERHRNEGTFKPGNKLHILGHAARWKRKRRAKRKGKLVDPRR